MSERVTVSRPDKVFYPADGITKREVFDYYGRVADAMVPHLAGRPLTLRRYPDGIEGETFFQKAAPDYFPDWIDRVTIPHRRRSGSTEYVVCSDRDTLLYLVNQACLEFHIWTSTTDALEKSDRLVIDIDPPGRINPKPLREVARRIADRLAEVGLTGFVQTTGGKGFHVVAPLDRTAGDDTVRSLARAIADRMVADDPDRLTTELYKDKRRDRIFLDTNRNGFHQTWICPYSLRARPGAGVATPVSWRELARAEPAGYGIATVPRRLAQKRDPWHDIDRYAGSATAAAEKLRRR